MNADETTNGGGTHHHELFPRQRTAALVAEAEASRSLRESLAPWLIGAGIALLALGLPIERLWGNAWCVPAEALGHAALGARVRELAALLDLPAERAWFLVSALAWGAVLPVSTSLLVHMGFSRRASLGATLIALLSPIAWTGARVPGAFTAGMLGAAMLARALVLARREGRVVGVARSAAGFGLAVWLHPQNVVLLPAVIVALAFSGSARGRAAVEPRALVPLLAHLALAAAFAWLSFAAMSERGAVDVVARVVLAGRSGGPLEIAMWIVALLLGLGVALFGLHALFIARRAPEESSPPLWLHVWCAAAVLPIVAGSPAWAPGVPWLPVATAVGWAAAATQLERGSALLRAGLAIQIVLALVAGWVFERTDPEREWRELARVRLEKDDCVLTRRAEHAYLVGERWGVEALRIPAMADRSVEERLAAASGRRIVLDGSPDEFPEALRALCIERGAVSLESIPAREP